MERGTKSTNKTPFANENHVIEIQTNMPTSQVPHLAKLIRKLPRKKLAQLIIRKTHIALNPKPTTHEGKSTKPNQPKSFIYEPSMSDPM